MISDVLECLHDLSMLGTCCDKGPRWYGRTPGVRGAMTAMRLGRWVCALIGIAGIVVLSGGEYWVGGWMLGAAVAFVVGTYLVEFVLIRRGLMVIGPSTWPPRPPTKS